MIADLFRMLDAFQAAIGAARAVMDGRHPVLVDDVLAAEGCSCSTPRLVGIHNRGTACGRGQHGLLAVSLDVWAGAADVVPGRCAETLDVDHVVRETLDLLAEEADRRDGVRRGPR